MSETRETTLHVEGMTCGHCVKHVTEALRKVDGVSEVDVRLGEKRAVVQHDLAAAPLAALIAAVEEAGYEASAR
jgi:copper chaperone